MAANVAWPMPGRLKIPSVTIGPGQQRAEVDAEERDHRDQRVPQGVHADHPPLGQPLGPGGADVVGPHRFDQAGPGQAGHVAQRQGAEHHGRQEVAAPALPGCPTTGNQPSSTASSFWAM